MLEAIQNNLVNIGVGLALTMALGVALKKIPALLEEKARAALDKLFTAGDAADDAFLIAAISWAEAKYGPGSGAVKADAVVRKIEALLPLQYRVFVTKKVRAKTIELFQASFDRLEAVALAAKATGGTISGPVGGVK